MRHLMWLVGLSLLVVLAAVAYPYVFPVNGSLDQNGAVAFVMDDVRPLEGQGVQARVVDARSDAGKWAVDVLLTRNAHSACPAVEKRLYTLPPVAFRSESLLSSCNTPVSIDYREEALIASANALGDLGSGAYGCAFTSYELETSIADSEFTTYCPSADVPSLRAFADGLPANLWVVQWSDGGSSRMVALSSRGQLLKPA